MAGRGSLQAGYKCVKPIWSLNMGEAHLRVLGLYKAYYRYIPYILKDFDMQKNYKDVHAKIRENFYKNAHVEDIRVIDILIIKGYMELKELKNNWQQKGHVFSNFNPTLEPRPADFISKFIEGRD